MNILIIIDNIFNKLLYYSNILYKGIINNNIIIVLTKQENSG